MNKTSLLVRKRTFFIKIAKLMKKQIRSAKLLAETGFENGRSKYPSAQSERLQTDNALL